MPPTTNTAWGDSGDEAIELDVAVKSDASFGDDLDNARVFQHDLSGSLNLGREDSMCVVRERVAEPWFRHIISVHTAIAAVCVFGIAIAMATGELLGQASCNSALEDTRETTSEATTLLGDVATKSLNQSVSDLLGHSSIGIIGLFESYLHSSFHEMWALRQISTAHIGHMPKNDSRWFERAYAPMWGRASTLPVTSAVVGMGIIASEDIALAYYVRRHLPDIGNTTNVLYASYDASDPSLSLVGAATPITGKVLPIGTIPVAMTVNDVQAYIVAKYTPIGEMRFGNMNSVGNDVGLELTEVIADPTGSVPFVSNVCFLSLQMVDTFMRDIVHKAILRKPTSTPRVFATMASSWLAEMRRADGDPHWESYNMTNYLAGVSNGIATELYNGTNELLGLPGTLRRPLLDINASDPIIRGIATAVGGNYAFYDPEFKKVEIQTVNGTQVHIVGTRRMQIKMLDLWIVQSLDAASVYDDLDEALEEVQDNISSKKEEVASDIRRDRTLSQGITLGVGVVLLLISSFVSYRIVSSIKRLQRKMASVANMELDGLELEARSPFIEMRRMQNDFARMVDNLLEFRAYVPSAVLEGSAEKAGAAVPPPTGKVAIVFTDIRGSTGLWRHSPGDMNRAMEIHNDTIRKACAEHEGYEVKTIGDSFMVSFPCPLAAARFALCVQTEFAAKKWPTGLGLPKAGLVVRVGVNYGATIAERNPVTGRVDYRGSTVNLASRVEGLAKPGTICITSDMLAVIKTQLPKLGQPVVHEHGVHDIRGLGDGHELFLLVPASLRCRLQESTSDCTVLSNDAPPTPRQVVHFHEPSTISRKSSGGDSDSSTGSSVQRGSTKKKGRGKTALQVSRSSVTVAVCRLRDTKNDAKLFDNSNIMVRAAVEAAHATGGVIGNVTGRTLTVVWNASKKCTKHSTAALTFAQELYKLKDLMQVGLATGTMLHGNIGTRTSRFATAFGVPLEAAEAMTDHARMFGVYCLYADCTSDNRLQSEHTIRSCVRLVDVWRDVRHCLNAHVYEVHLQQLQVALQGWGGEKDGTKAMHVDLEYHTKVINEAMQDGGEGVDALRQLVEDTPSDGVIRRVLEMLEYSRPKDGYRCAVTFSRVPFNADYEAVGGCLKPT